MVQTGCRRLPATISTTRAPTWLGPTSAARPTAAASATPRASRKLSRNTDTTAEITPDSVMHSASMT
jgi:hypothetical protein